jgi:23S rRNA (uracil1939-C5)-methyltransferase
MCGCSHTRVHHMTYATSPLPLLELNITRFGAMGDGVGEHQGKPVFVPFTCAGDVIQATVTQETKEEIRAELHQLITPSPQRQTPPCVHFGVCGGCSLQHLNAPTYQAFKQAMLASFIHGMGVDVNLIEPMVEIKAQSRRRAEFKILVHHDVIQVGFFTNKSHDLIDITECPISDPAFMILLPAFKQMLTQLKAPGRLHTLSVTALPHGLDVTVKLHAPMTKQDTETLVTFAKQQGIIRLHTQIKTRHESRQHSAPIDPICLYDSGKATVHFAGIDVALPSGAFLQATQEGQEAITSLVTKHLQGRQYIADLYSGCGTYSFALIQQATRVAAYEGAAEMAAAMNDACVRHNLDDRMSTTVRDLFTDPLSKKELFHFDGVVINPPRNGALPQIKKISESRVKTVVMVSCNPATFKRDAKQLLGSGYTLTSITPIDQFYWSRHLELVAVFQS